MSVILVTGPIASGKSVIGNALADRLNATGQTAIFIDLDEEVLKIHGSFDWSNDRDRAVDWLKARQVAAINANKAIAEDQNVVVAGPFYLQDEIVGLTKHLDQMAQVLLYILEVPLKLRLEHNRRRAKGSPDEQVIEQDDAIKSLPMAYGAAIQNIGNEQDTVELLLQAINSSEGRLWLSLHATSEAGGNETGRQAALQVSCRP